MKIIINDDNSTFEVTITDKELPIIPRIGEFIDFRSADPDEKGVFGKITHIFYNMQNNKLLHILITIASE